MADETTSVVNPVAEDELKQQHPTTPSPAVVVDEKNTLPEDVSDATKPSVVEEAEKEKVEEAAAVAQSVSFKEETNVVGDLPDLQKKALDELKVLIQEALDKNEFVNDPTPPPPPATEEPKPAAADGAATETDVVKEESKDEEKPVKDSPAPVDGVVVVEEEAKSKSDEEVKPEPAAEATTDVVVETAVDDDGAKTVEAIEETIVAVSTPTEPEQKIPTTETPPPPPPPATPEQVSIWGIPLLTDERSDVILLKFLRARDFKVKEAFNMLRNTVRWRKDFKIDELLEQDFANNAELNKVVFMKGFDKEGHPVCYNVYGEFQNKDLYNNALSDEEKRLSFLRWRIQFLEKSIRKLDFSPSGVSTIVQVNDLKNSPGPTKKELRLATNQALQLLQDNYPEFVAKQVHHNPTRIHNLTDCVDAGCECAIV